MCRDGGCAPSRDTFRKSSGSSKGNRDSRARIAHVYALLASAHFEISKTLDSQEFIGNSSTAEFDASLNRSPVIGIRAARGAQSGLAPTSASITLSWGENHRKAGAPRANVESFANFDISLIPDSQDFLIIWPRRRAPRLRFPAAIGVRFGLPNFGADLKQTS